MSFLQKFRKKVSTIEGVNLDVLNPTFWIDCGNYVVNKILSGNWRRAFAQGRLSCFAGPSGAGKSFLAANAVKNALKVGIGVLYIDTENAIDTAYLEAIGVDTEDPNFTYVDCIKITQCVEIVNEFLALYREEKETKQYLIVIDSLDMLLTDGDAEKYEKGEIGGDQGQWAKQVKKMLQVFMQDIKRLPIAMLCTKQVYVNQDPVGKYQEPYKFTDCLKFAFSQITVVSKLLLKDESKDKKDKGTDSKFKGINLVVYGFKNRFTKPFQKCTIEVPYDEGMDKYTGVLDAAISFGIVEKNGGWMTFNGEKFQKSTWNSNETLREKIFETLENSGAKELDVMNEDFVEDLSSKETHKDTAARRIQKLAQLENDDGNPEE